MKTKFQVAAAAAVMATASMALYAASPATAQKMDADGDKAISWTEAKGKADTMWAKLDVNKDGKIDPADRDAKIGEKFASIDTDKNGAISRDEFIAHHAQMKPGTEGGEHHERGGKGHHGMKGGGMRMLGMADANKDGTVTRAEFDIAGKAHFDKADANKDGKISADERRAAMKAMMGMMRGPGGHHGGMGDGPPPPPMAN